MSIEHKSNEEIVSQAISKMKEQGIGVRKDGSINLLELGRQTGLSRQTLRTMEKHGFSSSKSRKQGNPSISGSTAEHFDALLRDGVTNAVAIKRILETDDGYRGSISSVKRYRAMHLDLVPAKRELAASQGRRINRYCTGPGEMYQMDWGFIDVDCVDGTVARCAVFAMVCHHCGMRYIEFFPNARQESLFIGMVHAFIVMGIPKIVLTDNMASVVNGRFPDGTPKWNHDYAAFEKAIGFSTKLCKARHPFTKGSVERLVRFVKDNFAQGRTFLNVTDLNEQGWRWCAEENSKLQKGLGIVPAEIHSTESLQTLDDSMRDRFIPYLAPERSISLDGFVSLEGRRYGVPFAYTGRKARVMRDRDCVVIMDPTCSYEIARHSCDWSLRPHYCEGQFESILPEELPTAPVRRLMKQIQKDVSDGFSQYDFAEEASNGLF